MVGFYKSWFGGLLISFGYTNNIKEDTNDFLKDIAKWMTELAQL